MLYGRPLAVAAIALASVDAFAAGEDASFMPPGGRTLVQRIVRADADVETRTKWFAQHRDEAQWRTLVATGHGLAPQEVDTLAAYLSVNTPVGQDAVQSSDLASALPPDGRDLAWEYCQSCHSLFTSYLTQSRDAQAWRNMFLSPFHRQMRMTAQEREEFARYSAINMPMKVDAIPPELRF